MGFCIRKLFSNLFLSVIIEGSECLFYGRVFKNGKVVKTLQAKFTEIDPNNIDEKVIAYIKRQEDAYYGVYIALLYTDDFQGALPTLNKEDFKRYNIRTDDVVTLSINYASIYADISAVNLARNTFGQNSIDLLYSPIALMFYEIRRQGVSEKTTMYIYSYGSTSALSIFKDKKMKFATFFKIKNDTDDDDTPKIFKKENITDIDNLIIEDENKMSSMDDFTSLDDLIMEKPKEFEDLGYDLNMPNSSDVATSVTIFGRDMSMFRYINSALKEFYTNPIYDGDFIEQVIVFDSTKTSATFLHYVETELFVETSVHTVDALKDMNELMTQEIEL
ncbi:hypothetical protein LMG7974_00344 [Campylobacter majalis]|uniref:Uncharacterized protein n=1 Tax=Campylobacter majalis TaxID=2790656 RepID=A0ABM8Q3S3_9BACT|nr:hypothetical protein [Campylobacter majalis]CAD7287465.1 hypothetical protein LMG7974_00344 [Campylobacter majalis]